MNRTASIFSLAAALMLCGCSSHNNSSVNGLTPSQAQHLSSNNATFTNAKQPPITANMRFAAGQLAEAQNNIGTAITQYKAALDIDARHLPSLFRLGVIYAELRQFDNAIPVWQRYVQASNESADSYGNLGFCCDAAGMAKEAQAAYSTGIEKEPKNLLCRTNYGLMLARQNHIQEAIRMWQPVLSDAEIHYNLASVYELDGRKREAKVEYQKALDTDPNFTDAKTRMAGLQ